MAEAPTEEALRAFYDEEQASLPNCVQRESLIGWDDLSSDAKAEWAAVYAARVISAPPAMADVQAFYEQHQLGISPRHRLAAAPIAWGDLSDVDQAAWTALYQAQLQP